MSAPALDDHRGPLDLRLVPPALAAWAVVLAGLLLGPGGAAGAVGAALVVLAVSQRSGRRRWAVRAAAACAAAAGLVVGAHGLLVELHPLRGPAAEGASATLRVVVTDDPRAVRAAAGLGPGRVLVEAHLQRAQVGEGDWSAGGRVLLLAPAPDWAGLLPGRALTADGLLAPATRPDLTVAVLRVRGPPRDVAPPPWWQTGAGALRDGLRTAALAALPPAPGGLLPGLAVGDTSAQTTEVEDDFRAAGLSHLTAVSGANLAIVAGAVLALARVLRADPRWAALLSALAVAGFVVLARPSPSVVRAAAMAAVVLLALGLGRARSAVPALAAAVLVLLLVDPALAGDAGFALSVLATAALVLLAPGWAAALHRRGLPVWAAEAIAVPAAAFLATAPVVAGLNGQVAPVAVVANLLAVPAVAPATVLGVLAALVSPVAPWLAHALAALAGPAVGWLVLVGDRAAAVPDASLPWPDGAPGALLLVAALAVLALVWRWRSGRALLVAVLLGLALVLVPTRLVPVGWPPAGWAAVACDVGQGDAVVLATGEPGRAVLVDTGGDTGPVDACLDRLGVHTLALVVLSHLHADHTGGLAGALRDRVAGGVAVGPVRLPHDTLRRVALTARDAGAPVVALTPGQRLSWPGLVLDVLGPVHPDVAPDPEDGTAVNDGSLVLRAGTAAGSVLLTGDVELAAQADLVASGIDLRADVLKMPHHGSRYSSPDFLAAVAPRAVLVSVGAGNPYRHPDPVLLGALERAGALVRRTDLVGDTAVVTGLRVVTRGSPLPAPRRPAGPRGPTAGPVRGPGSGALRQRVAHGPARRRDRGGRADLPGHGVEGLEAVPGDQQHRLGVRVDPARLDELLRRGHGDAARRLGEHALRPRQQADALHDLGVADVADRAAGAAHRVEHVGPVGRVADGERAGDGVRPHGLHDVVPGLEGRGDGRAARGLGAEDPVRGGLHEPQRAELGEALVHLGQLRAGRDRHHDLLGQAPAQLLGHLVAQRLRALGVVGAHVDVDERPLLVLGCQLRGQPVDVVVGAVHGEQRAAVDGGGEHLGLLEGLRHEHHGVPAGARGGGGHGVGEVAGGRAAQHREAQLAGRGQGHGHDAVLERVRRVARVVLDPQVPHAQGRAQPVGLDQAGEAGLGVGVVLHGGGHRQQVAVAPDVPRPGLDRLPRHPGEVVGHLERSEALRAGELGGERDAVAALAARERAGEAQVERGRGGRQVGDERHRQSLLIFPARCGSELAP